MFLSIITHVLTVGQTLHTVYIPLDRTGVPWAMVISTNTAATTEVTVVMMLVRRKEWRETLSASGGRVGRYGTRVGRAAVVAYQRVDGVTARQGQWLGKHTSLCQQSSTWDTRPE